jgi:hypothetical protein
MGPNNPTNNIVGITFSIIDFFHVRNVEMLEEYKDNALQETTTMRQTESSCFTTIANTTFTHQIFAKNPQKRTK